MEREGKKGRGNSEKVWESESRRGGSSCWEGIDLAGQSHGAGLRVPSERVGVRPKHGGLRKMKPLPRQIRRTGQSFLQEEISTNLKSKELSELSIQGGGEGKPNCYFNILR